jgi:microcystin-dependent protein
VSPVNANVGHLTRLSTVSPFLVLNFTIALQGIFPSQS